MAFREVRVYEVKEVLRLWLRGKGTRPIAELVGLDRKRRSPKAAKSTPPFMTSWSAKREPAKRARNDSRT